MGRRVYVFEGLDSEKQHRVSSIEMLDLAQDRIINEKGQDIGRQWQIVRRDGRDKMELLKTVRAIPIGIDRILLFGIDSKTDCPLEFRVFNIQENTFTFTYRLDINDQEGL